ncbi:MAG: response regulator [Synergistales bacterium]|nr:response regulator [Synergistales bacterium]
MKTLVVEDDKASAKVLESMLSGYGSVDIAWSGREALDAFAAALQSSDPYDLVCLDIMMPEMDGQSVLKELRRYEEQEGLLMKDGVTVLMTTALGDRENVFEAFREQCDGYLIKPIARKKLDALLEELQLIEAENTP